MDVDGKEEQSVSIRRFFERIDRTLSLDSGGERIGQALSPQEGLRNIKHKTGSPGGVGVGPLNNLELTLSPGNELRNEDQLSSPQVLRNLDQPETPQLNPHCLDQLSPGKHQRPLHSDHLENLSLPENEVVNILYLPSSSHQESENVDQPWFPDSQHADTVSTLSVDQPSLRENHVSPHADQSPGSQQTDEPSLSQHQVAQKVDEPSLPHQDSQNFNRSSSPPDKICQTNNSSSVHKDSQHVRKRPTLELQVSRHVNKPTSPLRFFQQADRPPSPYQVLQHISEEAVRVAGEALHSVYSNSPSPIGLGHRRSHSEVVNGFHKRSNSFQRLKSHMQKALRWGSNLREEGCSPCFNPEILANQKRQWYQFHSRALDYKKFQEPSSLFEHFIITGLHSDANLEAVEEAFVKRKKWELEMAKAEVIDFKTVQNSGPSFPSLEPQILFKYPPGKKLGLRLKDLSAFCFPDGVQARILEKTPSLSDLNELVYGQEHMARDDLSFIFSLKSADNATMYGVCLHVPEIVQRPPGVMSATSPMSQSLNRLSRYLVSAPRCYCVLTRVPFFELHYEMLNSIIAQERLNRITQFVTEMTLTDLSPSVFRSQNNHWDSNCPEMEPSSELLASAISVDDAVALTAAAAGIIQDDEIPLYVSRTCEPETLVSNSTFAETDTNDKENSHSSSDHPSMSSDAHSESSERMYKSCENGHFSPEVATISCPGSRTLERLSSSDSLFRKRVWIRR
ncbi:hypothetical protein QQ045_005801 [Rhodiola kirilowii]